MLFNIRNKVFCLGLPKTGTTSLSACFNQLGYKCSNYHTTPENFVMNKDYDSLFNYCRKFNFFKDFPWGVVFQILDEKYTDAKFILTERLNEDIWYKSMINHIDFKRYPHVKSGARFRKYFFGYEYPIEDEKSYKEKYLSQNAIIKKYFGDRLLVLCFEKGHGWSELCQFLEISRLNRQFPHLNKGKYLT